MVVAVRGGLTQRAGARRFRVGLSHLQYWLTRTRGQRPEQVDWSDQSHAPRQQGRQTKGSLQRYRGHFIEGGLPGSRHSGHRVIDQIRGQRGLAQVGDGVFEPP